MHVYITLGRGFNDLYMHINYTHMYSAADMHVALSMQSQPAGDACSCPKSAPLVQLFFQMVSASRMAIANYRIPAD